MEEFSINIERVAPAMNDFIGKLQSFATLATAEKKNAAMRDILTSVENLRSSLQKSVALTDSKSQINFNNQIERLFSEFNWNVNYTIKPYEHPKFLSFCKNLSTSIMKVLGKRNCGILVVEMYFKMCIRLINELNENVEQNVNVLKDLLLFQMLIKGFSSSARVLKKFWYIIILPQQKCSVMLCLNQSFKTLCLLGKVIDKRLTHLITYLLNRLKQCFNKILELLFNPEDSHNSEFILLMDSCLSKLDQLSYEMSLQDDLKKSTSEAVSSLKPLLDELLCHAMTVSHICNREVDCNLIKSCSQKVLDEFKTLTEHEHGGEMASNAERLSDILCKLEEVVNTAVLNVVLDVFIDINVPLRNLVNKSGGQANESHNKTANDLEEEIDIFDEHMDRIMHIGLFAVSCSTDVKKILGIRSCLASLESLEAELITSIISLYLHPTSETKLTFQFIFRNWLEEITELKNLMDLILDPAAFSQVVEKRITALTYELKDDDEVTVAKVKSNLTKILAYGKKLVKTLLRSIEHDDEAMKVKMKELVENLQLAYQECEASVSLLDVDVPPKEVSDRVLKRVGLMVAAIDSLIRNLPDMTFTSEENSYVENTSAARRRDDTEKLDYYKLNVITPEPNDSIDLEILTPYINRGKQRTKERTILYTTPRHAQHFQSAPTRMDTPTSTKQTPWGGCLRSQSRSRCCRPLPRNLELENSLDLELTALLDNVTDLSNTFKTTYREGSGEKGDDVEDTVISMPDVVGSLGSTSAEPELVRPRETDSGEKVFLGTIMRQKLDKSLSDLSSSTSLSIHKDSNCKFETPDRMHDLAMVQEKINFLMENIQD